MKKLNLYFVRHGQTIFNKYNRMQGWSDSPLTDKGHEDAKKAGKRLKDINFKQVISSDTTRAMNTAHHIMDEIGFDADLKVMSDFREEFYGYFEGADSAQVWYQILMPTYGVRTFHEFLEDHNITETKDVMKASDPFHDAENNEEFWDRLNRGFGKLTDTYEDGDNILIVSHGTTIRSLAAHADAQEDVTIGPENGSISRFTLENNQLSLIEYNNSETTPL